MSVPPPPVDLRRPQVLHIVGVGGPGMSAIATVLAGQGHRVSGSDIRETAVLDRLRAQGVTVSIGHRPENLPADLDSLTISTAIPADNLEVRVAGERGVPVLRRAQMLASIAAVRSTVAVAGTHGKTTTASMLALVLVEAGLHPSFVIGADVHDMGTGAAWDEGEWFVVEADESDGTFLEVPRRAAVVTNCEADHLEHYGSLDALEAAFARFVDETEGPVLACADDPVADRLARAHGAERYGTAEDADWRMDGLVRSGAGTAFDLVHRGRHVARVTLPVAGAHNARNACAAAAMALVLGAPVAAVTTALGRFGGVARRFQHRGSEAGVAFIDDYAHLPTEVRAALAAARDGAWDRVVAVFQPHRYSRTATLWQDFADAFDDADLVVLTEVYPAGEQPRPGVSGELVLHAVLDAHPRARVAYLPRLSDVADYLAATLRPGDVCLTLGAGDVTGVADVVLPRLVARPVASAGG